MSARKPGIAPMPNAITKITAHASSGNEAVESAQNKPVRGLAACGASPLQKIRFALWPQDFLQRGCAAGRQAAYRFVLRAFHRLVEQFGQAADGPLQKIRFALWPQVKPLFLSYGFMRLEINFRSST
jgi:phosphonate transport system permease protein